MKAQLAALYGEFMTTISVHQMNYLPWLGYFNKIKNSDIHVILDKADYVSQKFQNRNRIRTPEGSMWITIPIEKKYHGKPFDEVLLPKDNKWMNEHWKGIERNYRKSDFFSSYEDFFIKLYSKNYEKLSEMNHDAIKFLLKSFGITTRIIKASTLGIPNSFKKTELLVEITKKVGGDAYLSGPTGKEYIEHEKFSEAGISLKYQEFNHPVYKQRFHRFEPNMSAIDLLFNIGEQSRNLI